MVSINKQCVRTGSPNANTSIRYIWDVTRNPPPSPLLLVMPLTLYIYKTYHLQNPDGARDEPSWDPNDRPHNLMVVCSTGLFEMIVRVLTTCHTQYTWDSSIYVFLYLTEQHSKFLLHTLQVLYMSTLCDSTDINTIIEFVPNCL